MSFVRLLQTNTSESTGLVVGTGTRGWSSCGLVLSLGLLLCALD